MHVSTASFVPLYEQVKAEARRLISIGAWRPRDPLPSIRELAAELLVNPNTVARAYRELERDGLITTQKGKGCFVADRSPALAVREKDARLREVFDRAVGEAAAFGLNEPETRSLFEERLRRAAAEERTRRTK
jgi:GntR family transcriptional regulator